MLDTPARIYYKYEGSSPAGSHKLNTALAQVYYYQKAGIRHLTTGTDAGQWGSALAMACQNFGLRCTVYMVRVSYTQKPYRRVLMNLSDAEVIGEEALRQMELTSDFPDAVIGCMGAGSNFVGMAFPFYREEMRHGRSTRLVAVERGGLSEDDTCALHLGL